MEEEKQSPMWNQPKTVLKQPVIRHYEDGTASALRKPVVYTELRFYQRSDVLYQLTKHFCGCYLPKKGDRTVDQMVQAARSVKQNIAEGSVDGQTSSSLELNLLGVARGSNAEVQEDYKDYLKHKGLTEWYDSCRERFDKLHRFCSTHCHYKDYKDIIPKMDDEELANMGICLTHQIDSALTKYIEKKDREFTTEGGVKERMTAARLGQRASQKETIDQQAQEIMALKAENKRLRAEIEALKAEVRPPIMLDRTESQEYSGKE